MIDVLRRGDTAVHYVNGGPLPVGQPVTMRVDWARRHDHMQQHSGINVVH